jgi:signal transduction histidine kinase
MIQDMSRQTKPQDLMDAAVRNGARIMGVLACSIKLLDETGGRLRYAATYGLSPKYLAKGWIHVDQSPINRRILEGSRYIIAGVDETGEFQYPDDLKNEGIKAMLCLPLRVESKTLGVFCVYGGLDAELTEDHARFFGQMTDLTALAIERLNRETAKTWFMNKTAHQLRSPLAAVMGMIGLFEKGFLGPMTDPQRETLERCRIRLNLLVETVNDLLILAAERDAAISEEEAQGFDPARSLSALLMVHQAQAETKGLSFHARIVDRPAKIQGGRRSFEDLASNLVANAVKYTHPPGRVEVTLDNGPPGFVVLTVRDTGIGIPDEDRGRLFTEFFRGENARAVTEEGTGLGLVIAQRALERLGGVMDIQSALGRGATITCRLPAK